MSDRIQKLNKQESPASQCGRVLLRLAKNLFRLMRELPSYSSSYRVLRALDVASMTKSERVAIIDECKFPDYEMPAVYGSHARKQGNIDFHQMYQEGLAPDARTRKLHRYDNDDIEFLVLDICSEENVGALSFGSKQVTIPGTKEKATIPSLTRKRTVRDMFERYKEKCFHRGLVETTVNTREASRHAVAYISRTIYHEVVGLLTNNKEKMVKCVDYVTDLLLNEPTHRMQQIINDLVSPTSKKKLTQRLELARNFLKHQYDSHAEMEDSCPSHGLSYGLSLPSTNDDCAEMQKHGKTCRGCLFLQCFMTKDLPKAVEDSRTDANSESVSSALGFIKDSWCKFQIYQGHRMRVKNQRRAINADWEAMKEECIQKKQGGRAQVMIDWRMKWEALYFRESSKRHYGKRGTGWEGNVMRYWLYEAPSDSNGGTENARVVQISLDQILENGNQQDGLTVLSFLEALLMIAVSLKIPFLTEPATIISDNAGCYHKTELLLGIPFLNARSKSFQIGRFLHTETQDGKGVVDALFAVSGAKVMRYLSTKNANEFRTASTPKTILSEYHLLIVVKNYFLLTILAHYRGTCLGGRFDPPSDTTS